MVNKAGLIRIIEASIAVLIVFSALIVINNRNSQVNSIDLTNRVGGILDEISRNSTMRGLILSYNVLEERDSENNKNILNKLSDYARDNLKNGNINLSVSICLPEKLCPLEDDIYAQTNGDIFSSERIISTNLEDMGFNPKKIKLFLWLKR
jgi:hypothetical protein